MRDLTAWSKGQGRCVKKIPQSGNMQHPICGTETNDIFEGNCIFFGGVREKNWGGQGWGEEI